MAEPVTWRADGVPRSERFDDIYHTETGALAQARHVFLRGCGLPQAWAGQPQWLVLETGFGLGLNFLTTWQAWRSDPGRPRMLHFVSVEAHPVSAADLLRAAEAYAELAPLARDLAAQWHGLLPGFHRLSFDDGRVLLTLCVGDVQPMLRAQRFEADSIFLDGFSPQQNPAMWSEDTLKAVSRFARQGTRVATWTIARAIRDALTQFGFATEKDPGLPPKRDCLRGVFAPAWTVRRREPVPQRIETPGRCAVIGAGLAGAAVAASLARRGWQVTVLDAADRPASGASGLPVGMLAPHVSPDDALLSRLTRAGIRATWGELARLLEEGRDWRASGVLERRPDGDVRVPAGWRSDGPNESWPATPEQLAAVGLPVDAPALWHQRAAWVRPPRLIAAWLRQPGVEFRGGSRVARVARVAQGSNGWQLFDPSGELLADADRVVVCAGFESGAFAANLPLQPVRGQVAWGSMPADVNLPATPLNGDGHLVAHVPHDEGTPIWLAGATFDRDSTSLSPTHEDADANRERLARLHPAAASALEQAEANTWVGIRCASGDRRPLVGALAPDATDGPDNPGLWVCTALGSRGLSFAALCAELLAAQWHAEPLPLPATLAKALSTQRL
ncbi:FAD-dependent 5-carboxymethylaminomethyl-2-thiouridine(34) oxidoreductase MnmC [Variovorax sp. J22G73]|uniref:FAD-dependent 5-carboxymethylaminomethyl-2-thiouridine(34) oxidoreductase MnmC n=1 Tax=unclassified Variovorax TaxID=663243 RepID=UPI002577E589|nr:MULTISPECIES: FAD-dependent 5-carboxymethylaminomethyl-2-thiouridine(34) oxidoreductase MnmC [unclassified Variovorax]MDM0006360.1 FAD-dependent 5-carboxymethylaminomethyl-2-thiouridine(34) oxidoreductase MnmC [Variovorax sp. J22R203]MDM0097617.1 FAD-dependent 5-carboxymethylaminomethyl-2-thiouridine(34) oxidoreductase MnmC [Variovorax sp. J22G73]